MHHNKAFWGRFTVVAWLAPALMLQACTSDDNAPGDGNKSGTGSAADDDTSGNGADTDAGSQADTAYSLPTVEIQSRATPQPILFRVNEFEPGVAWFRQTNGSGEPTWFVRRRTVTDFTILAADPEIAGMTQLLLYDRVECTDIDAVCITQIESHLPESDKFAWPEPPFVALSFVSDPRDLGRMTPEETMVDTPFTWPLLSATPATGTTVQLDDTLLAGGPDAGVVLTQDQLIYAFKKARAYEHQGVPRFYADHCAEKEPYLQPYNYGDAGLAEFLADYTEGAGATATDEDFPPPQERFDRKEAYDEACGFNQEPEPEPDGVEFEQPEDGIPDEPEQDEILPPTDLCGNGAIDWLPTGVSAPPACSNPNTITTITNLAALQAWAANPVTSAKLTANIDFGGGNPSVVTNCDVLTSQGVTLSGIGNLTVVARKIDSYAGIVASGRVDLRASDSVLLRQAASITGAATLAIEAPTVDNYADASVSAFYCAEGANVTIRDASDNAVSGANVTLNGGTSLDVYGTFANAAEVLWQSNGGVTFRQAARLTNVGKVTMSAGALLDVHGQILTSSERIALTGNDIVFRQAARIENTANVTLAAGNDLDFHGTATGVQNVQLSAKTLTYRASGSVNGTGSTTVTVFGDTAVDFYGAITAGGDVVWMVPGLYVRDGATISSSGDVSLSVRGRYDQRGAITANGAVSIATGTYHLYPGHDLTDNTECEITGTIDSGSTSANGCVEN